MISGCHESGVVCLIDARIYSFCQPLTKALAKVPHGVDFSGQSIRVNGAASLARISRRGERYRYTTIEGNPSKSG